MGLAVGTREIERIRLVRPAEFFGYGRGRGISSAKNIVTREPGLTVTSDTHLYSPSLNIFSFSGAFTKNTGDGHIYWPVTGVSY